VQSGCALIGGETAEHPGMMPLDEYDLAGFCVGIVDKSKIIDNDTIKKGDILIALPSSGIHSNGFSLVRRAFDIDNNPDFILNTEFDGKSLAETLLTPTKIYVKPILALLEAVNVKGLSHITGGGFYENIPRCIPQGLSVKIARKNLKIPPIFDMIAKHGKVSEHDMFYTYNMGVGMVAVVSPSDVDAALTTLAAHGEQAYVIGEVVAGASEELFFA